MYRQQGRVCPGPALVSCNLPVTVTPIPVHFSLCLSKVPQIHVAHIMTWYAAVSGKNILITNSSLRLAWPALFWCPCNAAFILDSNGASTSSSLHVKPIYICVLRRPANLHLARRNSLVRVSDDPMSCEVDTPTYGGSFGRPIRHRCPSWTLLNFEASNAAFWSV